MTIEELDVPRGNATACQEFPLVLFRCYEDIRAHGDFGVALAVLSTCALGAYALLIIQLRWLRTCDVPGMILRNAVRMSKRSMTLVYVLGVIALHIGIVFASALQPTLLVPQLSFDLAATWTIVLWVSVQLLLLAVCCSGHHQSIPYAVDAMHASFLLAYGVDRLRTAQIAPDLLLPAILFAILIVQLWTPQLADEQRFAEYRAHAKSDNPDELHVIHGDGSASSRPRAAYAAESPAFGASHRRTASPPPPPPSAIPDMPAAPSHPPGGRPGGGGEMASAEGFLAGMGDTTSTDLWSRLETTHNRETGRNNPSGEVAV